MKSHRMTMEKRDSLTLRSFGVTEFATANVKDFEDLGIARVGSPISQ